MERKIAEKEAEKTIALIEIAKESEKRKQEVDSWFYEVSKEIETNEKKLTPAFLKMHLIDSLSKNSKLFFGESIPKYLTDNFKAIDELDV